MRKYILLITTVLIITSLYSTNSRDIFEKPDNFWYIDSSNNSANELSMGGVIGVANIWDSSPLGFSSNPAKLAYHDGISSGIFYTFDDNNSKQLATYTSLTWHGIGIMLPMPSQKKRFGEVNLTLLPQEMISLDLRKMQSW